MPTVLYGWEELVDTLSMKILGGSVPATSAQAEVSKETNSHSHLPLSLLERRLKPATTISRTTKRKKDHAGPSSFYL